MRHCCGAPAFQPSSQYLLKSDRFNRFWTKVKIEVTMEKTGDSCAFCRKPFRRPVSRRKADLRPVSVDRAPPEILQDCLNSLPRVLGVLGPGVEAKVGGALSMCAHCAGLVAEVERCGREIAELQQRMKACVRRLRGIVEGKVDEEMEVATKIDTQEEKVETKVEVDDLNEVETRSENESDACFSDGEEDDDEVERKRPRIDPLSDELLPVPTSSPLMRRSRPCELCSQPVDISSLASHIGASFILYCLNPSCRHPFVTHQNLINHMNSNKTCFRVIKPLWTSATTSLFTCEVCNFTPPKSLKCPTKLDIFREHLATHEVDAEKNHFCPVARCPEKFKLKQSLQLHLATHCETKMSEEDEMATHFEAKSLDVMNETPLSEDNFDGVSDDDDMESDQKPLKTGPTSLTISTPQHCELCSKIFDASILASHLASHVGDSFLLHCFNPQCRLPFISHHRLINHMQVNIVCSRVVNLRSEAMFRLFKCEDCGFILPTRSTQDLFLNVFEFRRHLETHEVEAGEKKWACPSSTCEKTFKLKQSLNHHLASHCRQPKPKLSRRKEALEVEHPFPCKICDRTFINRDAWLNHHLKTHSKFEITCDLCPASFRDTLQLRKHLYEEHHLGTQFQCEHCPATFFREGSLRIHVRLRHLHKSPERILECDRCGATFSRNSQLITHQIKEHGDKELGFPCSECEQTLTSEKQLQRHISTVHRGERWRKHESKN